MWSVEVATVGIRRWRGGGGGGGGGEEREGEKEEDDGNHFFFFFFWVEGSGKGVLGHDDRVTEEIWRVRVARLPGGKVKMEVRFGLVSCVGRLVINGINRNNK